MTLPSAVVGPTELAGIPVDSEYIAFVIDTSGSMQQIWRKVMKEVENVLTLYPNVKGFQILNDQGRYLFSNKKRTWMKDTPTNRRTALNGMKSWVAYSKSSPREGILSAVRGLYRPGLRMAIFVFGDDYMGSDFGELLERIERSTRIQGSESSSLRIHAIGFTNPVSQAPGRFSILMRELTVRNNGAFLTLPP
jgi:hypothetical protein